MEVILQFDKEESIGRIRPGFLQDTRSWILMPRKFSAEVSMDGQSWTKAGEMELNHNPQDLNNTIIRPELKFPAVKARFLRFRAVQFGTLPAWHQGAGGESFIFCDEVEVNVK
jgi:hypothetical protein